jgi:hypothetical protein
MAASTPSPRSRHRARLLAANGRREWDRSSTDSSAPVAERRQNEYFAMTGILTERRTWKKPKPDNAARRCSGLAPEEYAHVRVVLRFVVRRGGSWGELGCAMGAHLDTSSSSHATALLRALPHVSRGSQGPRSRAYFPEHGHLPEYAPLSSVCSRLARIIHWTNRRASEAGRRHRTTHIAAMAPTEP